jgi:uncharacterized protein YegP (UPF0339 family)
MDVVHTYRDIAGEYRWRRVSENGQVVADSGEGYVHESDCDDMAHTVNGSLVEYVRDEDDD